MLLNLISGDVGFVEVVIYILSTLAVVFLTMPIHEFAHAFAADKLGDPTPRYQGRLTLNPFAHIDYFGALCILIAGFGWAKPVEINSRNFKNQKGGMAITALAGPLSNLILAFVSLLIVKIIGSFYFTELAIYIMKFFLFIAQINIALAVFNLIPVPPLDGSRILGVVLPDRIYYKIMQYEQYIYFGLMAVLISGVLDEALARATGWVMYQFYDILDLFYIIFMISWV